MTMKLRRVRRALAAGTAAALLPGLAAAALDTAPVLPLDAAQRMVAGCVAKARKEGWRMSVAVVDAGANLVAFGRMDGAFLGSADVARLKAETSAKFPASTRQMEQLIYGKDLKGGAMPGMAQVPGLIAFAGGLPVTTLGGARVGAIGASGGLPDQDEACAQAGLDAAKGALE